MAEALLELEGVEARYGPVKALHGVSLTVAEGEIVAVLGANGAGKTTTLRAISGTVRRSGAIRFAGKSIAGRSPEAVARLGIGRASCRERVESSVVAVCVKKEARDVSGNKDKDHKDNEQRSNERQLAKHET